MTDINIAELPDITGIIRKIASQDSWDVALHTGPVVLPRLNISEHPMPFLGATAPEIARQALRLLRTGGWIQRSLYRAGFFCSMGAITQVASGNVTSDRLLLATIPWECILRPFARVIMEQYPDRVSLTNAEGRQVTEPATIIIAFNDHPETAFADVERIFEKVAASE